MSILRLTLALGALMPALAFAANPPPIGYAQSNDYFRKSRRPTLYQPLNLLDGREITVWCTATSDPLNDQLTFGFKGMARIDEIRVYTGNGTDDTTFKEFSRAKRFSIKGPTGAQSFTVADQRGLQSVALNPALTGAAFTLEILDQYPAEDPEQPVCITDVVFYSRGKPVNGSWLTQKLKFDRNRAQVLGTWYAGYEGAPERYMSFYFDGTYRFVYQPFEPGQKERAFSGKYRVAGTRVVLELPGKKGRATGRLRRGASEDGQERRSIEFSGGDDDLKQAFRDQI